MVSPLHQLFFRLFDVESEFKLGYSGFVRLVASDIDTKFDFSFETPDRTDRAKLAAMVRCESYKGRTSCFRCRCGQKVKRLLDPEVHRLFGRVETRSSLQTRTATHRLALLESGGLVPPAEIASIIGVCCRLRSEVFLRFSIYGSPPALRKHLAGISSNENSEIRSRACC